MVPVEDVGKFGLIRDIVAHKLPLGAWSNALNVNFQDGVVQKCLGQSNILTPLVVPYDLFACPSGGDNYWAYVGLEKIYGFKGSIVADITRVAGDYTGTEFDYWNGCDFNGIPIFNNGVDYPQSWSPVSLAQPLVNLPNWQASVYCKVMRAFKSFLIALDVSKSGTRDQRMVKWSHSAAPGLLPTSWDETDPSKDAGEFSLSEGMDALVDCMTLGNANILYLETSAWTMTLSGTYTIFNFRKIFPTVGMLAQDCGAQFNEMHFVVTPDDIVVHNGTQVNSVVDARLRKWIFNNLVSSTSKISFVVPFQRAHEIWFCFPFQGGGVCNMAAIWNWQYNTWTVREIPNVRGGASSLFNPTSSADLFDYGAVGDFATDSEPFGTTTTSPSSEVILLAPRDLSGILSVDDSYKFDGVSYTSFVEQKGITAVGMTNDGRVVSDPNLEKMVVAVRPRFDAVDGTTFSISIASKDTPYREDETPTWEDTQTFTVGTDIELSMYTTGRYLAIRFEGLSDVLWKFAGYDIDVRPLSEN